MRELWAQEVVYGGGATAVWAGTTLAALHTPMAEPLYFPLVVSAFLFVSPWLGIALCSASIAIIAIPPYPQNGMHFGLIAGLVAASASAAHAANRQRAEQEDFDRLVSVLGDISSSLDATTVLSAIVHAAREATGAKASSLRLLASDQRTLQVRAAEGLSKLYVDKGTVDVKRSSIDRRALNGEIVYVRDATTDPRFQYPEAARKEGIRSVLCVPLQREGSVIGVLRVYSARPRRFSRREIRMLVALAAQAVIAIRHAELHQATLAFLRKAAHELRAPLSAISSVLRVLLEGVTGGMSEKQLEMIQRADRRASLLLDEVNDLLALSRARLEKPAGDKVPLRLQDILDSVASLMRAEADSAGISLEVDADSTAPHILGFPDEIEELLSNLLSNAIKYTPQGGRVTASVVPNDDTVVVRIADTGIGIPEDELPRLFEEFHRCTNARRSAIKGTGLGMALVKTIADRHHAQVRVDSEEGTGTTIEVAFPVGTP